MARRMFDNGKFEDPWYRKLVVKNKTTYEYLQCKCDYAGVLDIDIEDLNYKVLNHKDEIEIQFENIKDVFKDKFLILDEKEINNKTVRLKIFIPRFIFWQYKNELKPNNGVHRSVFNRFKEEGIFPEPYLAPYVLKEDFENWNELTRALKERSTDYKELLKERKNK